METVGRLAKRYGLSRSTLLYYDRIGVLSPSGRSTANYRLYTDQDAARLEKILMFRDIGLPLEAIGTLLDPRSGSVAEVLEKRLGQINREIAGLRSQQEVILRLLKDKGSKKSARAMNKEGWTTLLRASGMDDKDMIRWHKEFERLAPEAHQDFLESLGIESGEIDDIRRWSAD